MPFYKVPNLTSPPNRSAGVQTSSPAVGHIVDQSGGGSWSDDQSRTSFAEMTEADRDSELMRRSNLEHKIGLMDIQGEVNTQPALYNKLKRDIDSVSDRDTDPTVRQTASPAGSSWSVDSAATGSTGSTGTGRGGDVTGRGGDGERRYAHPGEGLIARELREQQERENELRGRWKEMGLDVPDTSCIGETPFTIPQPLPEPFRAAITSAPSELDVSEGTCSDSGIADAEKSPTSMTSSFKRVQPLNDPDETDDGQTPYVPTNETPIEREIRLARQREEDLRQERGLPPPRSENRSTVGQDNVDSGWSGSVSSSEPAVRRDGGSNPSATGTLKKLANNRLQMELSKEKQRELELKTEGVINTISEDRKGDGVKYVDMISRHRESQSNITSMVQHRSQKPSTSHLNDEEVSLPEISPRDSTTEVCQRNGERTAPEMGGDSELLRRFAAKQNKQFLNGDANSTSVKSQAEQKIHEELNELLRREHELRQRQISGTSDHSNH